MSDDNKNFGLVESFNIDDGQLDGITSQKAFVLGYELGTISIRGDSPSAFECYVHAENVERVRNALRKRGRKFLVQPMANDVSEGWWWLRVKAK